MKKFIYLGISIAILATGIFFLYKKTPDNAGVADLEIKKTADKDRVKAGDTLTYTMTVTNRGPETAKNVTVTDNLPFGVTVKSLSAAGGECITIVGVPICDFESLSPDQSVSVLLTVTVEEAATTLVNTARVASSGNDKDPKENNRADLITGLQKDDTKQANVPVQKKQPLPIPPPSKIADLSLEMTADKDTVQLGDTLMYTIKVTNLGLGVASDVIITDYLPLGAGVKSVSTTLGYCSTVFFGLPICGVDILNPQESFEIKLMIEIDAAVSQKNSDALFHEAFVESADNDDEPEDNNEDDVVTGLKKDTKPVNAPAVEPRKVESKKISYGGFSCGFEEAILESAIDTEEVRLTLLPETNPENGIVVFRGGFPSYQATHVALFPGDIESPTNNLAKIKFSADKNKITLVGIDRASGFQLCTGFFEKGVAPERGGLIPAPAN
ncbi:MAG: DUF11 domain-containing protein [Parcubacteria group bacterium]|nr:DUF11 domain-containing protein [Parcubacteria group bacterium]